MACMCRPRYTLPRQGHTPCMRRPNQGHTRATPRQRCVCADHSVYAQTTLCMRRPGQAQARPTPRSRATCTGHAVYAQAPHRPRHTCAGHAKATPRMHRSRHACTGHAVLSHTQTRRVSASNPHRFQTIVSEFIIRWKFVLERITATVCWTESPFGCNACAESSLMMPGLRPE